MMNAYSNVHVKYTVTVNFWSSIINAHLTSYFFGLLFFSLMNCMLYKLISMLCFMSFYKHNFTSTK